MFNISRNGIVAINRGDDFILNVFINLGTSIDPIQYTLRGEDKLYFALMEPNQPFEHALIRKVFTAEDLDDNNCVDMVFTPTDTEHILPGDYYYMIKLYRADEDLVDTIVNKTKFVIMD